MNIKKKQLKNKKLVKSEWGWLCQPEIFTKIYIVNNAQKNQLKFVHYFIDNNTIINYNSIRQVRKTKKLGGRAMKFTKRNISKLERIITETFKELKKKPLYALEDCEDYIEFRVDGMLYDIVNLYYETIGEEINDYLAQFENWDFYTNSVIRFYK